jgi:ribose 5-phosphate isomerase B
MYRRKFLQQTAAVAIGSSLLLKNQVVAQTTSVSRKENTMNEKPKIVIAADPFALTLKDAIVKHLQEKGYEIADVGGTATRNIDYYDSCPIACKMLQDKKADRAILLCGTGMGMSVIANRFPSVVASCVESVFAARMCRAINDANALCLGAMIWGDFMACEAVDVFLNTGFTETLPQFADYLKDAKTKVDKIQP